MKGYLNGSWNRTAAVVVGLAVLGSAHAAQNVRPNPLLEKLNRPRKPNIIFILTDDLGYGDVGCYGQKKIKTPNIDRLAAEGMRFTQCYAGSTVCAPSRAVLLTGLHTGHARIRGNAAVPLAAEDVTVAELLKRSGYTNGAIGKWGMGLVDSTGTPSKKGFDEWFGYLDQTHAHDYYPEFLWRMEPGRLPDMRYFEDNLKGKRALYSHDLFTTAATNFIRINFNQSFFLYLAYTIPHANNELGRKTGNGMEVPSDAPYSAEPWPQPEKNKAAMISRLDADIGKILATLKAMKIDTNTVIFFSSDNGPHKEGGVDPSFFESSGSLRGIKRDMYEGGIRVPMIVRWPGKIRPGTVSEQVWAFWDFLPTACEIAGIKAPDNLDGISFLPTLLGRKQTNQHEFLYWEFHEKGSKQAVRMGDWKAVRLAPGTALELYDLNTDLRETNNIAGQHPRIVAKIENYLKSARSESAPWPIRTPAEAARVEVEKTKE